MTREQLAEVNRRERAYKNTRKQKNADPKETTREIVKQIENQTGRIMTSQEMSSIEAAERQRIFLQFFFQFNGNVGAACAASGVPRSVFTFWMNNHIEFASVVHEVDEMALDVAEQQLLKNIENGKEQSLFFFLCNKGRKRGWQDVRKMIAPKINNMKVEIQYPDGTKALPMMEAVNAVISDGKGNIIDAERFKAEDDPQF